MRFGTSREKSEGKLNRKKIFGLLMMKKGNAAEEEIRFITGGRKIAPRSYGFHPGKRSKYCIDLIQRGPLFCGPLAYTNDK